MISPSPKGRPSRAISRAIQASAFKGWPRIAAPGARDLTGKTSFADIAALARHAAFCIGNDTGPTHLAAVAGCRTLALFGEDSDPALCAPRGPRVAVLRRQPLASLPVADVQGALQDLITQNPATA
jgi:ADP-heptose:LPS heptosyltransferase